MGACATHNKYHSDSEQIVCLTTQVCMLRKLEGATRRWKAGIQANSVKWSVKGQRRILRAGQEIYDALDELEDMP